MKTGLLARLALFGGANGIAQVFSMVYYLLLARWLLPDNYGVFAGGYAAATLSAFMVNWGMDTWLVRQAAADPAPRRLVGTVLKFKGLLGLPWGLAVWTALTWLRPEYYPPHLLALILLDTWLDICFSTLSAFFNAGHHTRTVSALIVTQRSLRLLGAVALIALQVKDILPFLLVRLVFTALNLAAAVWLARPDWRTAPSVSLGAIWRQALPYAQSELLAVIYGQIDLVLLTLLASKTSAGMYAPALNLINTLVALLSSTFWLFVPYLAETFQRRPAKLGRTALQMMLGLAAGGGLAAFGLGLLGPGVVDLLLSRVYRVSGDLLQVMSPILFFKAISVGSAALLVAGGQQRQRLLPQLISAGLNLALNLWAIPRWEAGGAAVVYLISEAILAAGYGLRALFLLRRSPQLWITPPPS